MSSVNYENQILDAIQTIVNNAVETAGYDRTIKAMIVKCEDQATGKYLVKYQNSSFYAYSTVATESNYSEGTMVYVLVPGNDMAQTKTILGTVDALGVNYVSAAETENGYEIVGNNIITSKNGLNLCSYESGQIKTLYDCNETSNILSIDAQGANLYAKDSKYIICGANFRTALSTEQKSKGDYGIGFDLDFSDNATGETVTKTYIVNVNKMQGNPYNLTKDTRQVCVFEADGDNFIRINKIYIYERNFPITEEGHKDDIFVSSVELNMANELSPQEISANGLVLLTAKGSYFRPEESDDATREIKAQIRIKGKIMDSDSKDIEYYWFKENNSIDGKSLAYERHGGAGWECLNAYNETIEIDDKGQERILRSWIPAGYIYETVKSNNLAKENRFKCVAIYQDIAVSKEIKIYNFSSQYNISIESDNGTDFYYDLGYPTLTCIVNGSTDPEDYTYVWSVVDNYNNYDLLPETDDRNQEYNDAANDYAVLIEQLKQEAVLSNAISERLNKDLQIMQSYDKVTRVEKNVIYKLHVNTISAFSIYKCSVYNKDGKFLGTASITLTNSLTNTNDYSIIITEGEQVFKYNENGIAPNNHSNEKPQIIYPLSFKLFDNKGQEVDKSAILLSDISWSVPNKNTLIKIDSSYIPSEELESENIYTGYDELNFDIEQTYSTKKGNNTIQLVVKYKGKTISASTSLTFIKTGEIGTNGTEYICKIVPNTIDGSVLADYPMITIDDTMAVSEGVLNYLRPANQSKNWFKVQLWHNGEKIFDNIGSGVTQEDTEAEVKWEVLKNTYDKTHSDDSNIIINGNDFEIDTSSYSNPANIVKCSVIVDGVSYYATIPMIVSRIKDNNYKTKLISETGYKNVMYTTDGQSPAYDNSKPFTLEVLRKIDGLWEDVSILEQDFRVNYDWSVLGETYRSNWQSEQNLIAEKGKNLSKERNEIYYKPKDSFDGLCVNNGLKCLITDKDDNQAYEIYIPIHLYLNRYGNSAMNGWDGNSIDISEDEGLILAPQVGAGKKTEENGFTGVFMGQIQEADKEEAEFGLYGYNNGERTIALSAEDGSARFGKSGSGQIVIDPSTNEAVIRSGDYVPGKSGMEINLSEPSIKFGTGNFSVDKNGQVIAKGFATSSELESVQEQVDELEDSIEIFTVKPETPVIMIPSDTDKYPIESKTYEVNYIGTFKGKIVTGITAKLKGTAPTGIQINTATSGKIKFTVDLNTAIPESSNNIEFTFTYVYGVTYTSNQSINIALAEQGRDGTPGTTITSTSVTYQKGTSGTTKPTGTWSTDIPSIGDGEYLWTKTTVNYSDGKTTDSYSVSSKGEKGSSGSSSYTYIKYSESSDGSSFVNMPTANTKYIGIYSGAESTAPTDKTKYKWSKYVGDNGKNGNGITSITYYYKTTTNQTAPSAESITSTSIPTLSATNKYLWQKEVIDYSDASVSDKITVSLIAIYGDKGDQGDSYRTFIKYSANSDGTGMTDTPQENSYYIGMCTSKATTAPTDKTSYTWSLYRGSDGYDGYSILLSNEAQILQANGDGSVSDYSTATTSIMVYQGTKNITIDSDVAITPKATNVTGTISKNTTDKSYIYTVTNLSKDNGCVDFTITRDGKPIAYAKYTLAKTKAGKDGRTYYIQPSVNTISKDIANQLTPSTISFSSYKIEGEGGTGVEYLGRWLVEYTKDGNAWTTLYSGTVNESIIEVAPTADMKIIRAYLCLAGSAVNKNKALDFQSVPILASADDIVIGGTNILSFDHLLPTIKYRKDAKENEDIALVKKDNMTNAFTIPDCDGKILQNDIYYGNSEQETRSGKNLIKPNVTSGTKSGLTFSCDEEGIWTLNGTTTSRFDLMFTMQKTITETNQPYTLSYEYISGSTSKNGFLFMQDSNNGWLGWNLSIGNKTTQGVNTYGKVMTFGDTQIIRFESGITLNNLKFRIQFEKGSIATDFEPYGASPSPDYPSEIKNVKGIENYLKNSKDFNYSGYGYASSLVTEGETKYNDCAVRYLDTSGIQTSQYKEFASYIETVRTEPSSWYIFSFWAKGEGKIRTHFYPSDRGYLLDIMQNSTNPSASYGANLDGQCDFTVTGEWKRYWVKYKTKATATAGREKYLKNVLLRQFGGNKIYIAGVTFEKCYEDRGFIEDGQYSIVQSFRNQAGAVKITSFSLDDEKHPEGYELCSIGDIKDEYNALTGVLTKRIGKVVLNGSEEWHLSNVTTGTVRGNVIIQGAKKEPNMIHLCNSNNIRTTQPHNYFTEYSYLSNGGYYYQLESSKTGGDTLDNFKSWLSNNNVVVYYILEEPETIQLPLGRPQAHEGYNEINSYVINSPVTNSLWYHKGSYDVDNYVITSKSWGQTGGEGLRIDESIFEDGETYAFSYKLENIGDSDVKWIRGHSPANVYQILSCYIDGVPYSSYETVNPLSSETSIHTVSVIFKFTRPSESSTAENGLYIQPQGDGAPHIWAVKIYDLKIERGNFFTDWTPATSDLKMEVKTLYCYTSNPNLIPILPDDSNIGGTERVTWLDSIEVTTEGYLWQTTQVSSTQGTVYETPMCIGSPKIKRVYSEFLTTPANIIEPSETDPKWSEVQPVFNIKDKVSQAILWIRTVTEYEGSSKLIHSKAYKDQTWGAVADTQEIANSTKTKVDSVMGDGDGTVYIKEDYIRISSSTSGKELILNEEGIVFNVNGNPITAWSVDGIIDSRYISSEHLNTDLLTNNSLVMGTNYDKSENVGALVIRDRSDKVILSVAAEATQVAIKDPITETVKETLVIPEGFRYSNSSGFTHTVISKETGLCGYRKNASGNTEMLYGVSDDKFYMRKAQVEESMIVGPIEMIIITQKSGSTVTHSGIGFVGKS